MKDEKRCKECQKTKIKGEICGNCFCGKKMPTPFKREYVGDNSVCNIRTLIIGPSFSAKSHIFQNP